MPDLKRLENILEQLAQNAAQIDRKRGEASRPLFDEQLFFLPQQTADSLRNRDTQRNYRTKK